ncbi:MAG: hypothetical protein WBK76_00515 [Candidatus Saccharimonadales bacterium]
MSIHGIPKFFEDILLDFDGPIESEHILNDYYLRRATTNEDQKTLRDLGELLDRWNEDGYENWAVIWFCLARAELTKEDRQKLLECPLLVAGEDVVYGGQGTSIILPCHDGSLLDELQNQSLYIFHKGEIIESDTQFEIGSYVKLCLENTAQV